MLTFDLERIPLVPGARVLDVGCGQGRHTSAVARLAGVMAVGADISLEEAKKTKKRLEQDKGLGLQKGVWGVLVADITRLPFRGNTFDLVICAEVLEHVTCETKAVEEISRVVKEGGDVVVTVPRYLPERICWLLSHDYHTGENGHIRIYKKRGLISLLQGAGLIYWGVHWAHSLHTPYWWLKCLLGPRSDDRWPISLYHRFLVWYIMHQNRGIRLLEHLLNPILGKSLVLYARKE